LKELGYYKNLASITLEQAEVITYALQMGKYLDYIIRLILGVVSSAIFTLAQSFLSKAKK
jgi:hypothetical protein